MQRQIFIILTVLFLSLSGHLLGQDTTIYRQASASMFSNNYTFIKKKKSDISGTFFQYSGTDDMQYWYGQGVFIETNKKYFLTFDTTNNHNRVETFSSTGHSDTVYFKWFDWFGVQQKWFSIRYTDTSKNKNIYPADPLSGFVKIPKSELKSKRLSLFPFGSNRIIFDFFISENIDEISIYVSDLRFMHTHDKKKETLKKNAKGFTTIGMWTKEKPTQFVVQKKQRQVTSLDSSKLAIFYNSGSALTQAQIKKVDSILIKVIDYYNLKIENGQTHENDPVILSYGSAGYIDIVNYCRQYTVTTFKDGSITVNAFCFCEDMLKDGLVKWKERPIKIHDGGSCVFNVIIDLTKGEGRMMRVNGR